MQVETLIGYGSPNKANTHGVHGAPLGSDETKLTREQLKWKYGEFEIPDEVYDLFGQASKKGAAAEKQWNENMAEYEKKYPEVDPPPPRELAVLPATAPGTCCNPVHCSSCAYGCRVVGLLCSLGLVSLHGSC